MNRFNEPIDVAPILKYFGVLKKDAEDALPRDESVGEAFLVAMLVPRNRQECVTQLFPSEIPVGQSFFDQIGKFHRWIGISESGDEALGMIWAEAMSRLKRPQQHELLEFFAQLQGHGFFNNARSTWVVVRDLQFPADFLAEWLAKLLQAAERDMLQEDVWKTIRIVCATHHRSAIEVLKRYLSEPDNRRDSIAGYMLGVLRLERLDDDLTHEYGKVEMDYRESDDHTRRAIFNGSWGATARDRELTKAEFNQLIARSQESADDLSSTVCVICRLIQIACLPTILLEHAFQRIDKSINPTLSSSAKYHVANAASRLFSDSQKEGLSTHSHKWILAIQPLSSEDRGTWNRIGNFLCDVLKQDAGELTSVLINLCSTSASTIHSLMEKGELGYFLHELANHDASILVTKLLLSGHTATRRLGLFLLDELDVNELSSSEIASSDGKAIQLLFYEAQRTILNSKTVGRVLAAVATVVDKTPSGFQGEFLHELKLQCHNFSGGCRKEVERLAKDCPLVAEATKEIAGYFDALSRAHEAGINAMEVTGVRKAARDYRRRFNKQVSESAKSASTLLSMMKHVSLLYGRSSSQFIDGVLQNAIPLTHTSHSMEIPIVDFFDPEDMALRRMHASKMISRLLDDEFSESEKSDDY